MTRAPLSGVIATHEGADLDGFASMTAARYLHPQCTPVLVGGASKDLLRLFEAQPDLQNALVQAETVDLSQIEEIVLVDCRQPGRLGPIGTIAQQRTIHLSCYDHHPPQKGDLSCQSHDPHPPGANTTLLVEALINRNLPTPITAQDATLMVLGILEDTGMFAYTGVQARDLKAAAWLLEQGANLPWCFSFLRQELTRDQVHLLDQLYERQQALEFGDRKIVLCSASPDHAVTDAALAVSKMLDSLRAPAVIALIAEGNRIAVIARSADQERIPVNALLAPLGGGGHPYAASASLRATSLAEAENQLLDVLSTYYAPTLTAEAIMVGKVLTIASTSTITEAKLLLGRYHHRGAPIIDTIGTPLGYVHWRLLDHAQRHGLGEQPVADYAESLPTHPAHIGLATIRAELARHPMVALVRPDGVLAGILTEHDLANIEAEHALPLQNKGPGKKNLAGHILAQWGSQRQRALQEVGQAAQELGSKAFIVGGCVRDLLMKQAAKDIDVVVEGDAIALAQHLAQTNETKIRIHRQFGTATLTYGNGLILDLASSRIEYYPAPAELPQVRDSGINADLWRRDFTVNAMAVALNPAQFGQLLDPYHGHADLREKTLRVLHSLSFIEDPTRILRAIRFEARIGFHLDRYTEKLARQAIRQKRLEELSGPRTWKELKTLLNLPKPQNALQRIHHLALWPLLYGTPPENALQRIEQTEASMEIVQWARLLYLDGKPLEPWQVVLRTLYHGIAPTRAMERLGQFQLPKGELDSIKHDLLRYKKTAEILYQSPPWECFLALSELSWPGLLAFMALHRDESIRAKVSNFVLNQRNQPPLLTGKDLQTLGIARGPLIGTILRELQKSQIENTITTREEALNWVTTHWQHNMHS